MKRPNRCIEVNGNSLAKTVFNCFSEKYPGLDTGLFERCWVDAMPQAEFDLWQMVYEESARAFSRLRQGHPYPEWIDEDFEDFVSASWQFKSLLSMSLSDYVYTEVSNPFHEIHRGKRIMGEKDHRTCL